MKKTPKTLDTLVQDIYNTIEVLADDEVIDIPEEMYEEFGRDMEDALRHWATPVERPKNGLRMSNIGRPIRRLWYDLNLEEAENFVNNKLLAESLGVTIDDLERWEVAY